MKIQHELARYYKRGNLVSYFLNNAAKTCLYGLKISENIETGHFFQSRTFFHSSSNLHTSCLSAFKLNQRYCDSKMFLWNMKEYGMSVLSKASRIKVDTFRGLSIKWFMFHMSGSGIHSNSKKTAVLDSYNDSNILLWLSFRKDIARSSDNFVNVF